jgi:hypothetical protein
LLGKIADDDRWLEGDFLSGGLGRGLGRLTWGGARRAGTLPGTGWALIVATG